MIYRRCCCLRWSQAYQSSYDRTEAAMFLIEFLTHPHSRRSRKSKNGVKHDRDGRTGQGTGPGFDLGMILTTSIMEQED